MQEACGLVLVLYVKIMCTIIQLITLFSVVLCQSVYLPVTRVMMTYDVACEKWQQFECFISLYRPMRAWTFSSVCWLVLRQTHFHLWSHLFVHVCRTTEKVLNGFWLNFSLSMTEKSDMECRWLFILCKWIKSLRCWDCSGQTGHVWCMHYALHWMPFQFYFMIGCFLHNLLLFAHFQYTFLFCQIEKNVITRVCA